jgi:hypothetical protein
MKRFSRIALVLLAVLAMTSGAALLAQGGKVARRVMTDAEFLQFKADVGVAVPGRNYNVIVDGHGTGLRPPTAEQWDKIRYVPIVADLAGLVKADLPDSVDNSTEIWFPPIGNQDGEGSCTAWATTYYLKTFQEAQERDLDLSKCLWEGGYYGYPSVAFQDQVFSPDFIYHLINGGRDHGSWFWDAIDTMEGIGAASWANMPYDPRDSSTWPAEAAWRQAPLYRNEAYFLLPLVNPEKPEDLEDDSWINDLKSLLAGENLAVIGVDANLYSTLSEVDLWTSNTYVYPSVNHANTIVGYDKDFGPYTENNVAGKYGAFKVANSWGVGGWEKVPDGFYWITPLALKQWVKNAHCYENIVGYEPKMIAVFEIDHSRRGDCKIDVAVGPDAAKRLNDFTDPGRGNLAFPDSNMVMDMTELLSPYPAGGVLSVLDEFTRFTGTIQYFALEMYDNYLSGVPTGVFVWDDWPLATINGATVSAEVSIPGPFLKDR